MTEQRGQTGSTKYFVRCAADGHGHQVCEARQSTSKISCGCSKWDDASCHKVMLPAAETNNCLKAIIAAMTVTSNPAPPCPVPSTVPTCCLIKIKIKSEQTDTDKAATKRR